MTTSNARTTVTRRTALAGLSAGGLGLAVATRGHTAAAQEAATDLAGHPLVGTWMAMTPFGASPETLSADGSFVAGPPIIGPGADGGVTYLGPAIGVWESTGERT